MWNGYGYISIESGAAAKHLGGDGHTQLSFDRSFFKGKRVVLCDDIKTSGKSLQRMRQQLESLGATVVCALTIGVTVHE
jgi:orotate phosphoribosyltransferase